MTPPPAIPRSYVRWMQLKVDKSSGHAPAGCDVCMLEVGMEGVGAPVELEVAPKCTVVPGR